MIEFRTWLHPIIRNSIDFIFEIRFHKNRMHMAFENRSSNQQHEHVRARTSMILEEKVLVALEHHLVQEQELFET